MGNGVIGPHRAALQVAPHGEKRGGGPRERNNESAIGVRNEEKDANVTHFLGSGVWCSCGMGEGAYRDDAPCSDHGRLEPDGLLRILRGSGDELNRSCHSSRGIGTGSVRDDQMGV